MKTALVANLYNPHEQSKRQLVDGFVVRQQAFRALYQTLIAPDNNLLKQPHYLIEGQRGMGKTTLLLRLSYEIETNPSLQNWLIPVVFKEEAYYGIRSLYGLWESIAQELERKDPAFDGLARRMTISFQERSCNDLECYEMLSTVLQTRAKKVVLFIDNLGELLNNFSDQEYYRLYQILQTSQVLRIVGASTIALDAFTLNRNGFQAIFQATRLSGLNKQETRSLLLQLAASRNQTKLMRRIIADQPGRVESLRILTGGVIRTIVLLFEIFLEREDSHTLSDLNTILDRVTPLYKSRMDELAPLQREVVNAMALHWNLITPEVISDRTNLLLKEVNTILRQLEYKFLIERIPPSGNHQMYRLRERFFNIWYLMRLSRDDNQTKVLWLVRFLENWYSTTELSQRAQKHIKAVKSGKYQPNAAFHLTEAFVKTGQLEQNLEQQMIQATEKLLQDKKTLLPVDATPVEKKLFEQGDVYYRQEKYAEAIQRFEQIRHKNAHVTFRLGYAYSKIEQYPRALSYLGQAAKHGNVEAMVHIGRIYHYQLQEYFNAKKYYLMAAEKGHTDAMLHLGHLYYYVFEEYHNAKKYYSLVVQAGQMRSKILRAKAVSLQQLKNFLVKAIKGNIQHPEQYEFQNLPGVRKHYLQAIKHSVAEALFQLGNLHSTPLKNLKKAERFYHRAAKAGHTKARVVLGEFYHYTLQDYKRARSWYHAAVKQHDIHALVNLGFLYHNELQEYAKAEECYLIAADKGNVSAMNALAWLYFEQKREKSKAFFYAHQALGMIRNICTAHTAACVCLWNNRPEEAFQIADDFMYAPEAYDTIEQDILFYLTLLLAKQHYQQARAYFESSELDLQERFQPVYYVLLYMLEDASSAHILVTLPPELAEPVKHIIQRVKQLRTKYA
ncbi:MAG: hypothetical protein GY726_03880 [Proteobacteria bacterium]|nr:hypothetical protein [Pseudomonadota bacterium]